MSVTGEAVSAYRHLHEATREIIGAGHLLTAYRMVPATSGNFSVRLDGLTVAVTRSGTNKGALGEEDVVVVEINAPPPAGASAETELHLALYRDRPQTNAVLHGHSNASAILSRLLEAKGELVLEGWELQKALAGQTSHAARVVLPILPNSQDIPALAIEASSRLAKDALIPAYLIAGHGFYTWGRSIEEAKRHAIALDHLLTCELELRRQRP